MTGLLDTNVALYLIGGRLVGPLPLGDYGLSVITEIELLAWPSLTPPEETKVKSFLQTITLCDLTPEVRQQAVRLRREDRLKLPDAIICATALAYELELWTNDHRLLNVSGLRCRSVVVRAEGSV